jgi:hypothetical protein
MDDHLGHADPVSGDCVLVDPVEDLVSWERLGLGRRRQNTGKR